MILINTLKGIGIALIILLIIILIIAIGQYLPLIVLEILLTIWLISFGAAIGEAIWG